MQLLVFTDNVGFTNNISLFKESIITAEYFSPVWTSLHVFYAQVAIKALEKIFSLACFRNIIEKIINLGRGTGSSVTSLNN